MSQNDPQLISLGQQLDNYEQNHVMGYIPYKYGQFVNMQHTIVRSHKCIQVGNLMFPFNNSFQIAVKIQCKLKCMNKSNWNLNKPELLQLNANFELKHTVN